MARGRRQRLNDATCAFPGSLGAMADPSDQQRPDDPGEGPGKSARWIGLAFIVLIALWWFSSFFKDIF